VAIQLAGKRFEYILEADRKSERPTVFYIRELTARQRRDVASVFIAIDALPETATQVEIDRKNAEIFDANMHVCAHYIERAAPILDADGNEIDLPVKKVFGLIKTESVIKELALAVISANQLNETDKKKSVTRPKRRRRG